MARHGLLFEGLVAFGYTMAISRRRVGVAIEDAGVEFGPVLTGEFSCAGPVRGVVLDGLEALYPGFLCFELLIFVAVGDAGDWTLMKANPGKRMPSSIKRASPAISAGVP